MSESTDVTPPPRLVRITPFSEALQRVGLRLVSSEASNGAVAPCEPARRVDP